MYYLSEISYYTFMEVFPKLTAQIKDWLLLELHLFAMCFIHMSTLSIFGLCNDQS